MKNKPGSKNTRIYGAALLMRNLTALVQEIDGVRLAEDIEYIHRMRVATRRLRSALPLFGPFIVPKLYKSWTKPIRDITRALGEARDADVQIEHILEFLKPLKSPERAGVRRLLLRLRQKRNRMQKRVVKALEKFENSGVVASMAEKLAPLDIFKDMIDPTDPKLLQLSRDTILEKLAGFFEYEGYIHQPECVTELHAMRIAAKRLRYTMEYFAPLYENELKPHLKVLRSTQDLLGSIHDCDVWGETLPVFIEEERRRTIKYFGHIRPFNRLLVGLQYYQQVRQTERQNLYKQFITEWDQWQQQGIWFDLQTTLEVSLSAAQNEGAALPSVEVSETVDKTQEEQ